MDRSTKSISPTPASGTLHLRGAVAAFVASAVMTGITAGECSGYYTRAHSHAPLTPLLLFASVYWLWWGLLAVAIWWLAQRWPSALASTTRTFLSHIAIAGLLGLTHLILLQKLVVFSTSIWPETSPPLDYLTLSRFGFELLLYGFVLGFSGMLHVQSRAHLDAMRSLELEKQLSQAQLKALQMQMEPHFLFNTLNAVTSLVDLGRNQEASETLAHLNTILRKTLQRSTPEKITFSQELQVVESYLAIQQVRFADRLRVKIETTPEALEGLVPCFLLQPIIENAIRHGISRLEGDGLLETSVERIGDKLQLRVKDNGPGLKPSPGTASGISGHGIGMQNTRDRLSYFYPGAYNFLAAEPATGGYEVTIQIPYERQQA